MNSPIMTSEVIEAIKNYFGDDEEIAVDCLLYLSDINSMNRSGELAVRASRELEKMGRCYRCGRNLQAYSYNEYHNELTGCPIERITEYVCPVCDMNGGGIFD